MVTDEMPERYAMLYPHPLPQKELPTLFVATMLRKESFIMDQNKIRKMTVNSMMAAMCAVLGYVSLDMGNIKVTFESFPIMLGALLFGPASGALIAVVGDFIYQIIRYGFSATTLLWIVPYVASGLVIGWYAKKNSFELTRIKTLAIVLIGEIIITALNTGVMYIDAKIYGYYSFAYIFGATAARIVLCIGKGAVFGIAMPPILSSLKKALKM